MNTLKYYLYKFFHEFILVYPVYPLLFESKGMSITEISMLLMIWSVPALLFEVPSGIIADRWSRKKLLVIGSVLKGTCFICWFFADGFAAFAGGFVLWGLGGTMCSGAEEALLFDSLKCDGKEDLFDKILGKGRFFSGLSMAAACLGGGYLTDLIGMKMILIFSAISMIITTGITFTFREVNLYCSMISKADETGKNKKRSETLKDSLMFFRNRGNLILVILAIMVVGTAGVLDEYDPMLAEDFGLSYTVVGLWVCVRGMMTAVGGLAAPYLKKLLYKLFHFKKKLSGVFTVSFMGAVFLLMSGILQQLWSMSFYGFYYLMMSSCSVFVEDFIQQKIEEEGRSTVHSILSLLLNLFGMIFFGILGAILSIGSLFTGLIFAAVYMLAVIIILWAVR